MLKSLCLAVALLCGSLVHAQTAIPDTAVTYVAFGEKAGLVRLVDDFATRLLADPRTAPFFKDTKQANFRQQLVDQFCYVLGGPCVYKGVDMKNAHADMDIRKGDFNALVELLQQSMDAQGIAFRDQNRLLAQLAPMHRDVITK